MKNLQEQMAADVEMFTGMLIQQNNETVELLSSMIKDLRTENASLEAKKVSLKQQLERLATADRDG